VCVCVYLCVICEPLPRPDLSCYVTEKNRFSFYATAALRKGWSSLCRLADGLFAHTVLDIQYPSVKS
jgi:hypothetical protein